MKIACDDQDVFEVVSFNWPIAALILLITWPMAGFYLFSARHIIWAGCILAIVGFFAANQFGTKTVWLFDKAAKTFTWSKKTMLSRRGGVLPFGDIIAAKVQLHLSQSQNMRMYRLVVHTQTGEIALDDGYSTGIQTQCQEIADRITMVLAHARKDA